MLQLKSTCYNLLIALAKNTGNTGMEFNFRKQLMHMRINHSLINYRNNFFK